MANWNGLILTDAGRNLQAKVEAGKTKLSLTKFKLGDGALSGQQTLEGLTDLVSPKQVIGINTCTPKENGLCTITGTIVNTGLTKGYELKELGVFATDSDSGEILYAITTDTHPDYLQPEGGATVVSAEFSLNIAISNTDKVTAVIDVAGLASIGNVHMLIAEHNRAADAHGNVIDAHNSNIDAHANGIEGNAATATRLKPALNGSRNQCWLICKLPKTNQALVHYKVFGAQYHDQYACLEVVIKNGFGWCRYTGSNTSHQVFIRAYDTGSSIDMYLFAPGYCDIWELHLVKEGAVAEFTYRNVGDASYVPTTGNLVVDTSTGIGCGGVDIWCGKQMATIDDLQNLDLATVGDISFCHVLKKNHTKANGAVLVAADYPRLKKFVIENNLSVTEAEWQAGKQGMYVYDAIADTLQLPDLRGEFLRGLDDGRGIDAGRVLGTMQTDAIRNITAYTDFCCDDNGSQGIGPCRLSGAFYGSGGTNAYVHDSDGWRAGYNYLHFNAARVVPTAAENRPHSIALIAQIKY